ncbi:hypothetical protein BJ878DRAFT_501658 [Calycina marina]|uniref:Uncharacterized protein n=1 Tax=Calycina marina TaxID=1763456 RepID=A0A9P7Z4W1_9HELO|nr:hypothetical protein BJ878DRAFT_501658 [Calycina marina]
MFSQTCSFSESMGLLFFKSCLFLLLLLQLCLYSFCCNRSRSTELLASQHCQHYFPLALRRRLISSLEICLYSSSYSCCCLRRSRFAILAASPSWSALSLALFCFLIFLSKKA